MQYVDFFGHKVSKLIVGDNPFNGWSYIPSFVDGKDMKMYHTEEKILEAMFKMEELGINTMLPLADPFVIRVLSHYRNNGGKMNFIFQSWSPLMTPELFPIMMRMVQEVEPIGMYVSGTTVDVRRETDRDQEIRDLLAAMRPMGIPIGICTHRAENIAEFENGEGWDFDFYMACMYNARRNRERQESGFLTGKSTKGDIKFHPTDRGLMLDALQGVKKPILAFKIFAGGQMLVDHTEEERRELIRDTYETVFSALKPDDMAVVGVFQKYHDQLTENVSVFNEWAAAKK